MDDLFRPRGPLPCVGTAWLAAGLFAGGCSTPVPREGAVCGDGVCTSGRESIAACPEDCELRDCGNGVCDPSEGAQTCPDDCAPCLGLTSEGCCDGSARVYCLGGVVRRDECRDSGCGWSGTEYRCGFSASAESTSLPHSCGCEVGHGAHFVDAGTTIEAERAEATLCVTPGQRLAVGALLETITMLPVCAGTAIADDVVVTAAHCVLPQDDAFALPPDVVFSVGLEVAEPEHVFTVARTIPHPDYDGTTTHDVALLVLEQPVSTFLPDLEPLKPMLEPPIVEWVGSLAHLVGYGIQEVGGAPAARQTWTTERVSAVGPELIVVDSDQRTGLCDGDSGAPLLLALNGGAPALLGVLSAGSSTCTGEDHFVPLALARQLIEAELDIVSACDGLDEGGRCTSGIAQWCHGGVFSQECCALGCRLDVDGRSRCRSPEDICSEADDGHAECGRGQLVVCEAGLARRTHCAACGRGACTQRDGAAGCAYP